MTGSEKQIYDLIAKDPTVSADTLANQAGKHRSTVFRTIKKLKEKGYLDHIGPDKTESWKILK